MSHGNVSHHVQVALDPAIDHSKFRVFSGFGAQLGPICFFGAAGVIDGLAAIYPKAVAKLYELVAERPLQDSNLEKIQSMQFAVSRANEMVAKFGIVGIKDAVYRVLNMGNADGGRLPLKGRMSEEDWTAWKPATDAMAELEAAA